MMEQNKELKTKAQTLRKNATKEENLLWYNFLRLYKLQFRRQYVIGDFIVDFYCHKARLVVELDGSQHYEDTGIHSDQIRTQTLEKRGLLVLRIPNNAINQKFTGVCEYIDSTVKHRVT